MPRRREKILKLKDRMPHPKYEYLPRAFSLVLQPVDRTYLDARDEYTYNFKAAPRQNDPVLRLIIRTITALNQDQKHGLLMCNHNIRVAPSTSAPPIWPPNLYNDNNFKIYTFHQDLQEFPATVPISVIPRVGPLTEDKLFVRENGTWAPLRNWLIKLADDSILYERDTLSITYFWRKRSGQKFRIMDLPVELRLMIFEYVVAPRGEVYPLSQALTTPGKDQKTAKEYENAHVALGVGYRDKHTAKASPGYILARSRAGSNEAYGPGPAPEMALLHVSRQIKAEALQAGWQSSIRCFKEPCFFSAVVKSKVGVALQFDVLSHIRLDFTASDWFKFFGIEVDPLLRQDQSASLVPYLAQLKDTCILELRFRDPWDGYDEHPWDVQQTMCQSQLVDWVMTFAFAHIIHIKRIKLVGFVRKPQREKWLDIISKHKGEGDFQFDYAAAIHAILDTDSNDLPPRCVCRKSCHCYNKDRLEQDTDYYGGFRSRYFWRGTLFDFEDGADESVPED